MDEYNIRNSKNPLKHNGNVSFATRCSFMSNENGILIQPKVCWKNYGRQKEMMGIIQMSEIASYVKHT